MLVRRRGSDISALQPRHSGQRTTGIRDTVSRVDSKLAVGIHLVRIRSVPQMRIVTHRHPQQIVRIGVVTPTYGSAIEQISQCSDIHTHRTARALHNAGLAGEFLNITGIAQFLAGWIVDHIGGSRTAAVFATDPHASDGAVRLAYSRPHLIPRIGSTGSR